MGEVNRYEFSARELAEILIKEQGLHDGIWAIRMKYGLVGGDVPLPNTGEMVPGGVLLIPRVVLQKLEKETGNSVNAAKVSRAKKKK